jgi:hypothetical protein
MIPSALLRWRPLLAAALVLTWLAPAAQADDRRALELARAMQQPVMFDGFPADPKMTLQEALDWLADRHDLTFSVNEEAFKTDRVEEVLGRPVAEKALPKLSNVRLDFVLRTILARIPAGSGATYVIRRDRVEVTTQAAVRAEFWGGDFKGPYLPLAYASFDKAPLEQALEELADASEYTVVLDGRVGDKAKAAVTARFANVPLDNAVRVLADTAGLKSVQVGRALYVTTKENAAALEAEAKEQAKPQKPASPREGSETKPKDDSSNK